MSVVLRPARPADNRQIAAIWNGEARGTTATTESEPRSAAAQRAWLARRSAAHPVIVAVEADEVLAFGALSPYRPRPSYRHTVEDSVYVKAGYRGKGLGGLILERLVALACARGHHTIVARVTSANVPSLRLHERHGFTRAGVEREIAFKLGAWLDVVTMQRLVEPSAPPGAT
jgi:L-amino acid N-acyltransferase